MGWTTLVLDPSIIITAIKMYSSTIHDIVGCNVLSKSQSVAQNPLGLLRTQAVDSDLAQRTHGNRVGLTAHPSTPSPPHTVLHRLLEESGRAGGQVEEFAHLHRPGKGGGRRRERE